MARPISDTAAPALTAPMPLFRATRVSSTSRRECSSTSPTINVADVSPWTPSRYTVTSMLMMSPEASRRESGIPWQITSFTDVHTDLGKPRYPSGLG